MHRRQNHVNYAKQNSQFRTERWVTASVLLLTSDFYTKNCTTFLSINLFTSYCTIKTKLLLWNHVCYLHKIIPKQIDISYRLCISANILFLHEKKRHFSWCFFNIVFCRLKLQSTNLLKPIQFSTVSFTRIAERKWGPFYGERPIF